MLSLATCETTGLFQLVEDQDWDDVILQVEAFPDEAKVWIVSKSSKAKYRRLPLHEAFIRKAPYFVIQCLLSTHPEAAVEPDDGGRLPIHHAAFYGAPIEALKALVMLYPESLNALDKKGVKPLDLFMEGNGGFTDEALDFFSKGSKFYATLAAEQQHADRNQKEMLPVESDGKNMDDSKSNTTQYISATTEHIDQTTLVETLIEQWPDEDLVRDESAAMRAYMEHFEESIFLQEKVAISKETIGNDITGLFQLIEDQDWDDAILQAQAYPEETKLWVGSKSSKSNAKRFRLPLHEATLRKAPCNVIECLLAHNPEAAREADESGSLPIHHAANHCSDINALVALARIFPGSLDVLDEKGLTPLDVFKATATKEQLKNVLLTNNPFQVALSTYGAGTELNKTSSDQTCTLMGSDSEDSKVSQDTAQEAESSNEIDPSKNASVEVDKMQEDFVTEERAKTYDDSNGNHFETIPHDEVSFKEFLVEEVQEKNTFQLDSKQSGVQLNAVADGNLMMDDTNVTDLVSMWYKETCLEDLRNKFSDDDHHFILAEDSFEDGSVKGFENTLLEEYFKERSCLIKAEVNATGPTDVQESVDFEENLRGSAVATMIEHILRDKKCQGELLVIEANRQNNDEEDTFTERAPDNVIQPSDHDPMDLSEVRNENVEGLKEIDLLGKLVTTGNAEVNEVINTELAGDPEKATEVAIVAHPMQVCEQLLVKGPVSSSKDLMDTNNLAKFPDTTKEEKPTDTSQFQSPESRSSMEVEILKDSSFEWESVVEESNDFERKQKQEITDVDKVESLNMLKDEVEVEVMNNIALADKEKTQYSESEENNNLEKFEPDGTSDENSIVKWIKGFLHGNESIGDSLAKSTELTDAQESCRIAASSAEGITGNTNGEGSTVGENFDFFSHDDQHLLRCEHTASEMHTQNTDYSYLAEPVGAKKVEGSLANMIENISTEALFDLSTDANDAAVLEHEDTSVNLAVGNKDDDQDVGAAATEKAVETEYVEATHEVNIIENEFQDEVSGVFITKVAATNGECDTTPEEIINHDEEKNVSGPEDQFSTITKLLTLAEIIHSTNYDAMDGSFESEIHIAELSDHKEEISDQKNPKDDRKVESFSMLQEELHATVKELQTELSCIQEDTENRIRKLNEGGWIYEGQDNFSLSENFDEVTYLGKENEELKAHKEEVKSAMDKLEEELANTQRATQEKSSYLDSELKRIEKDLNDAHSLLERTNTEKDLAVNKNILLCQEIDNLSAKNENLRHLIEASKEAENNLAAELEHAKCTEASLTRELEQGKSELKITQTVLEEIKAEVNVIKKALSDTRSLLESTTSEKEQAENKNISLCQEIESLSAKNENLLQLVAVSKEAEKTLVIELEHANITEASAAREVEHGKSELRRTQKLLEEAKTEADLIKKELSEARSLLEFTSSEKRQLERKNALLSAEIDSMSSKNENLLQVIAVSKEAEKILAIELEQAKCTETYLIRELEQEKAGVKRTQKLLEEAKGEVNAMSDKINLLSTSLSAIVANASNYRTYTSSSIDRLFSALGEIDQGRKHDIGTNHDTLFEKIQAV